MPTLSPNIGMGLGNVMLNYDQLRAVAPAPRTLFIQPVTKANQLDQLPAIFSWISGMNDHGHNIKFTNDVGQVFSNALDRFRPEVMCFSGSEMVNIELLDPLMEVKRRLPGAVTMLGGMAAMRQNAEIFDIVVEGEGEIKLPLILNFLQRQFALGKVRARPSIVWKDMVPAKLPDAFTKFDRNTMIYHPPLFTGEMARELLSLSAERYLIGPDHTWFPISVPIGQRIYVRSDEGVLTGAEPDGAGLYNDAKERWKALYGTDLPVSKLAFIEKLIVPIPMNYKELDRLSSGSLERLDKIFLYSKRPSTMSIYANRGCRGKKHCCYFCSIRTPTGRRKSVGQVMKDIEDAIGHGFKEIAFSDDLFIQSRRWVSDLLDRIEVRGYNKERCISILSRVDTMPEELLERLLIMGIFVNAGFETFDAARAEGMNKPGAGGGDKYVEDAARLLLNVAKISSEKHLGNFMLRGFLVHAAVGDTIIDVARDIKKQLAIMKRLLDEFRYLPYFLHNACQLPYIGDRVTPWMAGKESVQPGDVDAEVVTGGNLRELGSYTYNNIPVVQNFRLGETFGTFAPFYPLMGGGKLKFRGIYHPVSFAWGEALSEFIRSAGVFDGWKPEDVRVTLVYPRLIQALKDAREKTQGLEREQLSAEIEEAEGIYDSMLPVLKRVL